MITENRLGVQAASANYDYDDAIISYLLTTYLLSLRKDWIPTKRVLITGSRKAYSIGSSVSLRIEIATVTIVEASDHAITFSMRMASAWLSEYLGDMLFFRVTVLSIKVLFVGVDHLLQ